MSNSDSKLSLSPRPATPIDELTELKVKRSSVKGQITKFHNYLKTLDKLSSIQVNELTLKLDKFMTIVDKFETMQSRIEVLNGAELVNELAERDNIEESLHLVIATAQDFIEAIKPKEFKENFHDAAQRSHSSAHIHHCRSSMSFKLPMIQIHKFDGAYFNWFEFRDTYESLIHKNESIQPILKFHYLNSFLEGEAARVISNLEVSDQNYAQAWELLCERYNNNRQLITNHLNSLFSIEPLQRESDKSLRYLSDHVTKNL